MSSYEFMTTFVVRHYAGSLEGAIFLRNEYADAIKALNGEVVMAGTRPGDAGLEGMKRLLEDE